jgi:hypothetical protein
MTGANPVQECLDRQAAQRLCNACAHFRHVPFTCGFCARLSETYLRRITDERSPGESCGPTARYFCKRTPS